MFRSGTTNDTGTGFYVVGGTLHRDAQSYVPRQADDELFRYLTEGRFCYVLTSRQMGKSSLMVRTAAKLRAANFTAVVLDLTEIGQNLTVDQWYKGLLSATGEQLGLEDELNDAWHAARDLGPMQRWMKSFRETVLRRVPGDVVVFIDEIDAVRSLPFSTDEFFAAIRELYNRRHDVVELERLTFCLLGVASPTDLIRDIRTTPFNIGERIVLNDFTDTEAAILARGLVRNGSNGSELLGRVLYWTQGHPYLTQRLCQAVANDESVTDARGVDAVCGRLFLSRAARDTDDNLLFVRDRILRSDADLTELLGLYRRIRAGEPVADDDSSPLVSVLKLSGIIRVEGGYLKPRNRIYVEVFDENWARENLPQADVRRQKRAFKKGLGRAAGVAAVILAVMAYLVYDATVHRNRADEQRRLAVSEKAINRRLLYDAQINLAYQALERGDFGRVSQLLSEEQIAGDGSEPRGFEYYYLWRQLHSEQRYVEVGGVPLDVAYSHDGQTIAVGLADGTVSIRDARTGASLHDMQVSDHSCFGVAYSVDGTTVAATYGDRKLRLFDVATGGIVRDFPAMPFDINALATSPDGGFLAAGTGSGIIYVFETRTESTRQFAPSSAGRIAGVLISPDGRRIASGHDSGDVTIWDVPSGVEISRLSKADTYTRAAAFSPDGRFLVTGSSIGGVTMWDAQTGRSIGEFSSGGVLALKFSPDGETLAVGTFQSTVELWSVSTMKRITWLPGHTEAVIALGFAPDGKSLVSGSPDSTLRFWTTDTRQPNFDVLEGHTDAVSSVTFSPDGKLLASGSYDGTAILWDVATEKPLHKLAGHKGFVRSVAFSPNGRILATGADDGNVILWDVDSGVALATLQGHTEEVFSVAFSPNGTLLASGSFDDTVRVWDVASHESIQMFTSPGYSVECVAFSPDGTLLAAGGETHTVRLWDTRSWNLVQTLTGHSDWVNAIAFSPNGACFASVGSYSDVTIRLWDARTFAQLFLLKGFGGNSGFTNRSIVGGGSGRANCARFYVDSSTLVVGTVDRSIKMFDVVTGQEMFTLSTGHASQIYSMAFSPDGTRLATGSEDRSIRIFRAASPDEVRTTSGK